MQMNDKIYLDYSATTPIDPRVLDKMMPYFQEIFGNPSSIHIYGQRAETAVEEARKSISDTLHCSLNEIIFTSCGTESDNLAIRGVAFAERARRGADHILISPVEHHAVLNTASQLVSNFGFKLEYLPVDKYGMVQPDDVLQRIKPETALVSIIYANNEIGTINPITEIGEICQKAQIPFHTDAVQAGTYLGLNVNKLNVDLMSLGGHKFYGPKGVGALYIREGVEVLSTQTGGSQEAGLRAGTQNVPYIVGMAEALQIAQEARKSASESMIELRDLIIDNVLEKIPGSHLTGHPKLRLPNHASFVFDSIDGNLLLSMLDIRGYSCSSGSACKTGNPEPSEVLLSMGLDDKLALGSLRVSLGRWTTADQIECFLDTLINTIIKMRSSI